MDISSAQRNLVQPSHQENLHSSKASFAGKHQHDATILPIENELNFTSLKDVMKELKNIVDENVLKQLFNQGLSTSKDGLLEGFDNGAAPLDSPISDRRPPEIDPDFNSDTQFSTNFSFQESRYQTMALNIEVSDAGFSIDFSYSSSVESQFSFVDNTELLSISGSETRTKDFSFSLDVSFSSDALTNQDNTSSIDIQLEIAQFSSFERTLSVEDISLDTQEIGPIQGVTPSPSIVQIVNSDTAKTPNQYNVSSPYDPAVSKPIENLKTAKELVLDSLLLNQIETSRKLIDFRLFDKVV